MTSSLRFVIFWLPWLSVISTCAWAISSGIKENTKKNWTGSERNFPPPTFIPEVRQRGRTTIWIGLVLVMVAGLAGTAGYGIRDHQLATHIVPYTDVLILPPSQPNTDFDIQPARMKPIPSKLCQSIVDWKFGDMLDDLVFEQKKGCKRVISYHPSSKKGEVANVE